MNFSGRYKDVMHPEKLHSLSISVLLDSLEETPGGTGANIAYNLAKLGDAPILVGSVGPDAQTYIAHLKTVGVNADYVHHSSLQTASFNVITDVDDNQVGGFYPGAMSDAEGSSLATWKDKDALVVVSAHDPEAMRQQVRECKDSKIRLVYDPGQQVSNVDGDDLQAGLLAAEAVIVNDYEFGVLCEKTGRDGQAIKDTVPLLITTFGKDGSVIEGATMSKPLTVPAAKPDAVVDPTGAGDAFRAGFVYGYCRKWELPQCAQLATVVASFAVEKHGTQVEFDKEAVQKRYNETFNEEIAL